MVWGIIRLNVTKALHIAIIEEWNSLIRVAVITLSLRKHASEIRHLLREISKGVRCSSEVLEVEIVYASAVRIGAVFVVFRVWPANKEFSEVRYWSPERRIYRVS